jgi:hypothetical protein
MDREWNDRAVEAAISAYMNAPGSQNERMRNALIAADIVQGYTAPTPQPVERRWVSMHCAFYQDRDFFTGVDTNGRAFQMWIRPASASNKIEWGCIEIPPPPAKDPTP